MKTCPVCKTQVFDDMKSCFGCMHRFDEEPITEPVALASQGELISQARGESDPSLNIQSAALHATPAEGSWSSPPFTVRLELHIDSDPESVWCAEFRPDKSTASGRGRRGTAREHS